MDDDWRGSSPPSFGLIVDDRLDGRRVYPMPPRHERAVNRLRRLLEHARLQMLPFILLAAAQVGTTITSAGSSRDWFEPIVNLILKPAYAGAFTLLPAAVLIWGSLDSRSFKLLFGGAIVWSTLPAIAALAWWAAWRSPSFMGQYGWATAFGVSCAEVIACMGPAIIAVGLERARRGLVTSVANMARLVVAVTTLAVIARAAGLMSWAGAPALRPNPSGLDTVHLIGTIDSAALPLELACLLILAGSCLAALLADEAPSPFWRLAAAGGAILAVATLYQTRIDDLLGPATASIPLVGGSAAGPELAIRLAGSGLLLLAFAVPVWSAARGVVGFGRGAPEDIFTWGAEAQSERTKPIPMGAIVAVAAGTDHGLALDENGRVGAWGDDSVGQADVPGGLSGVIAVAAGDGFSLALRSDGTVAAWGANNLGQTSVPVGLAGVTAIAAGRGFSLALRADGTVVGWGDGDCGVIPVSPELAGVTAISAGEYHAMALLRTGAILAWGDNTYGQRDVPRGLEPATAIAAGGDFCLALLADGTVAAWGDNTYGQLDVPAGLANVTAIAAGAFHAVALKADGDVLGWGGGQGHGEAEHPWRLVDFKAVAAGDGFSLAIRAV